MLSDVKEIISTDFEQIYSSALSVKLLNVYSKLYLNGSQPKYCKASQLIYYKRLMKDGITKAKKMDEITKKTHVIKRIGLMYIGKPYCKHFDLENLTDKDANELLQKNYLKEKDFSKLPEIYKEEKKVIEQIKKEEKAKPKAKK